MLNLKTLALSAVLAASAIGAPLLSGAAHASVAQRGFTQFNNSSVRIDRMYIAASDLGDWTEISLSQGPIRPGASRSISMGADYDAGECFFDIEVDSSDGAATVTQGVDLCRPNVQLTFS
jgi:hypothetical protein